MVEHTLISSNKKESLKRVLKKSKQLKSKSGTARHDCAFFVQHNKVHISSRKQHF